MNKTICAFLFIAIAFCMVSCSSDNEYMNVIPKKSAMVISVDLKEMAQKSDINGKTGKDLQNKLTNFLKSGLTGKAYKIAQDIIEDPENSGLSFKDKVFIFSSSGMNATGFVAKVDDDDDVEDFLNALKDNNICGEIKEENDCKWTNIGKGLCAFNDKTFLILAQKIGNPNELKDILLTMMNQKKEDSMSSTDEFKKLLKSKGDISALFNSSVLPDYISMQLRMGMPADIKLDEIKYLLTTNFENGKIQINAESLVNNKSISNAFDDSENSFRQINSDLLKYYPSNTLFWGCINVTGKQFYDMLCKNNSIKHSLKNPFIPINVEQIFSSIDGDLSMGYFDFDNYIAYAQVSNNNFIQTVEGLRPLVAISGGTVILNKISSSEYEFQMDDTHLWFGVRDNLLYVTNNSLYAKSATIPVSVSLKTLPWIQELNNNRFFATVNISSFCQSVTQSSNLSYAAVAPFISFCDYINVMSPSWKKWKMDIVMKDRNTNSLQLLVREIQNL